MSEPIVDPQSAPEQPEATTDTSCSSDAGAPLEIASLQLALASSERQLAEARLKIAELESLLNDLPEIFERKFQQRLQPLLAQQEQLRQQVQALSPAPGEVRLRFQPDATSSTRPGAGLLLPALPSRRQAKPPRERRSDRRAA